MEVAQSPEALRAAIATAVEHQRASPETSTSELSSARRRLADMEGSLRAATDKAAEKARRIEELNAQLESIQLEAQAVTSGMDGSAGSSSEGLRGPACSSSSSTASPEDDEMMCIVCLAAPRSHILAPCGHKCVCSGCAPHFDSKPCPVCREMVMCIIGKVYE